MKTGKPFVWSYPLHFCPPDQGGAAVYGIVYGVGAELQQTVTFYGQVPGFPLRTLQTLAPGARATEYPAAVVPFGVTGELTLWATPAGTGPNGPRVAWGNGGTSRTDTLVCDCAQPATTVGTGTTPAPAVSVVTAGTVPGNLPPSE